MYLKTFDICPKRRVTEPYSSAKRDHFYGYGHRCKCFYMHFSINVLTSHQFGIVDLFHRLAYGVTDPGTFD